MLVIKLGMVCCSAVQVFNCAQCLTELPTPFCTRLHAALGHTCISCGHAWTCTML